MDSLRSNEFLSSNGSNRKMRLEAMSACRIPNRKIQLAEWIEFLLKRILELESVGHGTLNIWPRNCKPVARASAEGVCLPAWRFQALNLSATLRVLQKGFKMDSHKKMSSKYLWVWIYKLPVTKIFQPEIRD